MRFLDVLATTLPALFKHPFRTILTMLGIVIGIAAMVSMAAIGAGARARVQSQISAFGANIIMITPAPQRIDGVARANDTKQNLTYQDADAIATLPAIAAAAPSVAGHAQVVSGHANWATTINGTTLQHFIVRNWSLESGRTFSERDERTAEKVVILGNTVAAKLFGDEGAVGHIVRIMNTPFQVIGVLEKKGAGAGGQAQDDVAFVPLQTAMICLIGTASIANRDAVSFIIAKARSAETVAAAKNQIDQLLRLRHRVEGQRESDVMITNAAAMLQAQEASTRTVSRLLAALAVICLLTGGINIMNALLMSVAERRREIGLRLAIGAQPADIRNQFLLEALFLSLGGAGIGIGLGALAAVVSARLAGWPIVLTPSAVGGAFLAAAWLGLLFGFLPASRAARLTPVEAMKTL
jgi:putative ABC transport system permease protein